MTERDWTKQVVKVPELFDSSARAYEQCVVAGPLIFVAGQIGTVGTELASLEFEPQVRATFANVEHALRAAGATLEDLVSVTVHLTDARRMDEFLAIRSDVLKGNFATSTMVAVDKLYEPEMLIEITAIAVRSSGR